MLTLQEVIELEEEEDCSHQLSLFNLKPAGDARQGVGEDEGSPLYPETLQQTNIMKRVINHTAQITSPVKVLPISAGRAWHQGCQD